jgi:hypothetical protein
MKRTVLLMFILLFVSYISNAQPKPQTLKKILELKMPLTEEDDMPGKRGASIVWHPVQKKYYAVMAGNMVYPLAVFDAAGKRLSEDTVVAMMDTRGLWYNPLDKRIEANGYNEYGWFYYKLNAKGIPVDHEVLFEGMNQPDGQCVGAYNPISKKVLFLKGSQVFDYDIKTGEAAGTELVIHWGRTASDGEAEDEEPTESHEDYNYTTLVFTSIAGAEIGVLNTEKKQIELYNIKNGFLSKTLKLPDDATTESSFNFAFTNGAYWLFDMEARVWRGYK